MIRAGSFRGERVEENLNSSGKFRCTYREYRNVNCGERDEREGGQGIVAKCKLVRKVDMEVRRGQCRGNAMIEMLWRAEGGAP